MQSYNYVANEFENQRAVLLPHVSKIFLRAYHELTDCEGQEQLLEGTVKFTSRWLLKQQTVHLHSHMNSRCVHKNLELSCIEKEEIC